MPGFEFRCRLNGEPPTVRNIAFKSGASLSAGDMLTFEDGVVDLGATGDAALVGAALKAGNGERPSNTIPVVVDADAVYGVEDGNARVEGAMLDLAGLTGDQIDRAVPGEPADPGSAESS